MMPGRSTRPPPDPAADAETPSTTSPSARSPRSPSRPRSRQPASGSRPAEATTRLRASTSSVPSGQLTAAELASTADSLCSDATDRIAAQAEVRRLRQERPAVGRAQGLDRVLPRPRQREQEATLGAAVRASATRTTRRSGGISSSISTRSGRVEDASDLAKPAAAGGPGEVLRHRARGPDEPDPARSTLAGAIGDEGLRSELPAGAVLIGRTTIGASAVHEMKRGGRSAAPRAVMVIRLADYFFFCLQVDA